MDSNQQSDPVAGKTIRFAWQNGSTKGKVHEHVFHDAGIASNDKTWMPVHGTFEVVS